MQGQAFHLPQRLHLMRRQEIINHLPEVGQGYPFPARQAGLAIGPDQPGCRW